LENIKQVLKDSTSGILQTAAAMDYLGDVYDLIDKSIDDEAPVNIRDGGIIKKGYNNEIDELRELSRHGSTWLLEFEQKEKKRTGMKYLKVGYNRVFGYYLEVSKSNLHLVPDNYHRKQTLANTERFICEELENYEDKILGAREKLYNLEVNEFNRIREQLGTYLDRIQKTAQKTAGIDVIYGLSEAAYVNDYTRPQIDESGRIEIKAGRHPVVEKSLGDSRFVPNDVRMNMTAERFVIITGPNMGGKSTFMRQTAILVLMAQMGSFIPVDKALIGVCDKIFTRVGAADDLARGQSTFMMEMLEVANILNNATESSLIILDEIGRGTSTYDGLSIARSVSEYIHEHIKAKTLFATHYHELTSLSSQIEGINNLCVSVKESGDTVVFLKKVLPGKADKSYGVHVAMLAGLPERVIDKAKTILAELEETKTESEKEIITQPILFADSNPVLEELKKLNPDEISPKEALKYLYRWKEMS
jgi:DNA mismatch repair protein MutS